MAILKAYDVTVYGASVQLSPGVGLIGRLRVALGLRLRFPERTPIFKFAEVTMTTREYVEIEE